MSQDQAVLELRSISKVYGKGAAEVQALRDVSLTVAAGEMVAVMGPTGSGKSSLLTIAGTLEEPTSGAVLVNGEDTLRMSGGAKSRIRRRAIGYVFQDFNLLPGLTAAENVSLPLELDGTSMRKAHLAALKALEELGLGDQSRRFPDQLSGGERQRVAIARAVVGERSLLLADEPSGALDSANGEGGDAAHPRLLQARHRRHCRHPRRAARLLGGPGGVPARRPGGRPDRRPGGPGDAAGAAVMTMTRYERDDRPVREPEDPRRAAMARRTLTRWAVRLALREWKQRILIVALIAVASAATLLGIAVASATGGTPNAGIFGTASTLAELPGNTPNLPSVIAKIEKAYGPASVVYDEPIATGQAGGADLRAQDPSAPYTHVLLALDSGHYPTAPGQVAVTSGLARLYGLRVGSTWRVPAGAGTAAGRVFAVTGIVENPTNLLDEFALVAPGQLTSPSQVRIFLGESLDSAAASAAGDVLPKSAVVSTPMPDDTVLTPATIVLIISVLGLVFIGLVATASFTVMAQRRQRALGLLSSLGATEADVRFVLIADGLIGGVAGALLGAAAALGGWLWYYPHLETATAHRIDPFNLPWAAVIIGLLLAVATSVIAAVWPGRSVSKVPVVAALSGRIDPPQLVRRSLRPGLIFLAAGLFILYFSGGANGNQGGGYLTIAGMLCCEIAAALLAPFIVDKLSRLAWRAPLASRLALRDMARYRSRSGAALAAVSFAVFIATIAIVIASIRYDDALDYLGPNMASNQLILYTPGNDSSQGQPGQFTPAAKLAATQRQADAIAAQLHAPAPLELDLAVSAERGAAGPTRAEHVRHDHRPEPP